jgi:hypothetical protein
MYRFRVLLFATSMLAASSAHAATEINYWLWDVLQLPAYQAAAAASAVWTSATPPKGVRSADIAGQAAAV